MKNEDLIDTAPVILDEKTRVAFESLDLKVAERGEIVLAPDAALRYPTLYMTDRGSEVIVEAVFHGRTEIQRLSQRPMGMYRFGLRLNVTVTKDEPIKIVVVNNGPEPTNVGASLVDTPDREESSYHLRRDDLKGKEQT
jgi:hypothetical protein